MTTDAVPDPDWTPPKWLAVFGKRELQWLAFVQDARNRELRNIITRLREQLRKEGQ